MDFVAREESARYGDIRTANLAPAFISDLSQRVKLVFVRDGTGDLKKTFGPEDVFHYIYAVLHSPTYRERYAQFLKRDFPRVPLTSNPRLFRALCEFGRRLTTLHLLQDANGAGATFPVKGDNTVRSVRYVDAQQRVYINDTQHFNSVPPEVWAFHIGGYQVCHKWFKDRKGRQLTYDDITHYIRIVSAIAETINIMCRIDETISERGAWPID